MQCKDIHRILRKGQIPSGPGAQLHLSTCSACRLLTEEQAILANQLLALEAPATEAAHVPDALFASLQQQIAEEQQSTRQRLRELPLRGQNSILGLMVLTFTAFMYLFKARPDLATYPILRMGLSIASFLLVLAIGVWVAQRPVYKVRTSQAQLWTLWGLSLLLPVLFALLPEIHTGHPASLGPKGFWHHTIACFGYGIGNALPLILLASVMARQTFPRESLVTLVLAGGLLGNIALQIHCPINSPMHLGFSHAAVGVALLFGALALNARKRRANKD